MPSPSKPYFASLPQEEIGPELWKRVEGYREFLNSSPIKTRIDKSYRAYYGMSDDGVRSYEISRQGTQGELARTKISHFRNLIQHIIILVTAQKPAAQAIASNSDAKSQQQALLANGILDYYMREKRIERILRDAVEQATVCGEGFVHAVWNANVGREVMMDQDTMRPIREGDVDVKTVSWWNLIRDHTKSRASDHTWVIVRDTTNRYELAAQFPQAAEEILKTSMDDDSSTIDSFSSTGNSKLESDDIALYRFYHLDTDAVNGGREVWFLSNGKTVLLDTLGQAGLIYKKLPVHRLAAAEIIGTTFGYTAAFDVLGPQEVHDKLTGILLSNNLSTGAQRILIPRTANIQLSALAEDLAAIEYDLIDGAKPESLQLTKSAPETYKMLEMMDSYMETLAGISSVTRGDPSASLKSGSALALVQSQSIQFASGLQASYAALLEDVLTAVVDMLKMFATEPRKIAIGGTAKRWMAQEFSADDLEPVDRVTVEAVNPLRSTTAGRLELAQMLINSGQGVNPRELVLLVETGNLDGMLEPAQTSLLNMRRENETLARGEFVPVVVTDNHAEHIATHKALLDSPDARENPAIVAAFTEHVQGHISTWLSTDPGVLQLLGQQPPPQFVMIDPMTGQPAMGGGPAMQGPVGVNNGTPPPMAGNPTQTAAPMQNVIAPTNTPTPRMPRMPKNPMSGEQFDPNQSLPE